MAENLKKNICVCIYVGISCSEEPTCDTGDTGGAGAVPESADYRPWGPKQRGTTQHIHTYKYICMCIAESLCCAPETHPKLYINCAPIKINKHKGRNISRVELYTESET